MKAVIFDAGNPPVWLDHPFLVQLLREEGVEPAYVGDIYEIDVAGARAAGMHALLVDPLGRWSELDCDRIAALHEIPAWLDGAP